MNKTLFCTALLWSCAAFGESPNPGIPRLESIIVSSAYEAARRDLPVSLSRIAGERIQQGQALVNLSESLARVPGLNVQNRQNYAQDLQISARGFGARASFGVRGIRLFTDGIPATAPDGQGQVSHFDLGSAGHIEVLRGPFSVLYGNASGGVIALYTEPPPARLLQMSLNVGSDAAVRGAVKAGLQSEYGDYLFDLARFRTDGYREHSAARRDNFNAKADFDWRAAGTLSLVLNGMRLDAQDPLGLERAQFETQPRGVAASALQFDTHKQVTQSQLGAVYRVNIDDANRLSAMAYGGERATEQFLAVPIGAQQAPTHAGGMIDLERSYWGSDARWSHGAADADWRVTAGLSYDALREQRRGYENFIGATTGVRGALRRDEINTVTSFDQFAQAEWQPAPRWLLLAGLRRTEVKFRSRDRYITAGNGDDSGNRSYAATTPVAGITFKPKESWRVHAAYGRGFETPTANELAYRSTGAATGLNLALQAARSKQYEAGVQYANASIELTLAAFAIDTRDELAVLANSAGRAVYQNIGATRRRGFEFGGTLPLANGFATTLAYTYVDARYRSVFSSCSGTPCSLGTVSANNRIPGVPTHAGFAELTWQASAGLSFGAELRAAGRVFTDDFNSDSAPAYAVFGGRMQLEQRRARWRFREFLRIDNLTDRRYAGSVIVNESNRRYFEPAPGRTYLLGFAIERRSATSE